MFSSLRSILLSRIAKGGYWITAGALINRLSILIASIFAARLLGIDNYGQFSLVKSSILMFVVFSGVGLGATATKFVAELKSSDPGRAGRIIALSNIIALISGASISIAVIYFAPTLASNVLNKPEITPLLRWAAAAIFLNSLSGPISGALIGFEAFGTVARINIIAGLLSFPVLVACIFYWGITGSVIGLSINATILFILNKHSLAREAKYRAVPITLKGISSELQLLWKFSLPVTLSNLLLSPILWLCNTILVNQPDGYSQMAIFDVASQWRMAILFIPGIAAQLILPILSKANAEDNPSKYTKIVKTGILLNVLYSFTTAILLSILSGWIMTLYGDGFQNGHHVLIILAFSSALIAINNIAGQAMTSKNRVWTGLIFNSIWAFVLVFSSYILVSNGYGALGLATANLIAYIVHSALLIYYLKNNLKINVIN